MRFARPANSSHVPSWLGALRHFVKTCIDRSAGPTAQTSSGRVPVHRSMAVEFPVDRITLADAGIQRAETPQGPIWTMRRGGKDVRIIEVQAVKNLDDLYLVETSDGVKLTTQDRLPPDTVQQVRIVGPFALRLLMEDSGVLILDSYANDHLLIQILEDFSPEESVKSGIAQHLRDWKIRHR